MIAPNMYNKRIIWVKYFITLVWWKIFISFPDVLQKSIIWSGFISHYWIFHRKSFEQISSSLPQRIPKFLSKKGKHDRILLHISQHGNHIHDILSAAELPKERLSIFSQMSPKIYVSLPDLEHCSCYGSLSNG